MARKKYTKGIFPYFENVPKCISITLIIEK